MIHPPANARVLKLRPHHLLCTLCFEGKGYSSAFVANFKNIFDQLNTNPASTQITITDHTDSICAPCPHRQGSACTMEEKIKVLDSAHAGALDLTPHQVMSWQAAKQNIQEKMTIDKFHQICATCSWKPLGICERVLTDFLETPPQKQNFSAHHDPAPPASAPVR